MELTDEEVEAVRAEVRAIEAVGRVVIEINAIEGRLDILHEERRRLRTRKGGEKSLDKQQKSPHDLKK